MKHQNRVRPQNSAAAFPKQSQSKRLSKAKPRPVVLQFSTPNGEAFSQTEISPQAFRAMKAGAKQAGLTFEQFMLRCIEAQLCQVESTLQKAGANQAGQGSNTGSAGTGSPVNIAEALGLDAQLAQALELIARWERESIADCCREGVLCGMNASLDEMQSAATDLEGTVDEEERAWARQFYGKVKRLMNRGERRAA